MAKHETSGRQGAKALAWSLLAITVVLYVAAVWFSAVGRAVPGFSSFASEDVLWPLPWVGFAVVGAIVATKRSENPVGWLFLAAGVVMLFNFLAEKYAIAVLGGAITGPGGDLAAWFALWTWVWAVGIFIAFLVVFPTGRPPSRRWHWLLWAAAIAQVLVVAAASRIPIASGLEILRARTPSAVAGGGALDLVANTMVPPLVVAAVICLVVRFRRSRGQERLQLKSMSYAASIFAAVVAAMFALGGDDPLDVPALAIANSLATLLLPVAAGLSILRYRLYDIDRLVSRTVSWALVTAVLATVYLAAVSGLTAATAPFTHESSVAVAAATLAAAATFGPVRRRTQTAVDRRFNRSRYDAGRTVQAYRDRVRSEVDLEALHRHLLAAAHETLQPRAVSLWLREHGP